MASKSKMSIRLALEDVENPTLSPYIVVAAIILVVISMKQSG